MAPTLGQCVLNVKSAMLRGGFCLVCGERERAEGLCRWDGGHLGANEDEGEFDGGVVGLWFGKADAP